jgi:hypothetical protein
MTDGNQEGRRAKMQRLLVEKYATFFANGRSRFAGGLGWPVALAALSACLFGMVGFLPAQEKIKSPYFGIRIVDEKTGRGVPLVELRMVNDIVQHTDSGGWAAFQEPGLMEREIYFAISAPGYEYPKDGFGYRGVRLTTKPGLTATVKIRRTNIAERLYRVTGQGIHRDSTLLGMPAPLQDGNLNAGVLGQDSVQAVPYRDGIFWLWGDTNLPNYPLGNFQTTAAMSPLPGKQGFQAEVGVPFTYFADATRPDQVRHMVPWKELGPVWLFGLLTIKGGDGNETLVSHYTRQKGLSQVLEHGLVRFDDEAGVFKKIVTMDLKETWRFPRGNAFRVREADGDYFYFASPLAHTRVKATWECLLDSACYEALVYDSAAKKYAWQRDAGPTTQAGEQKLLGTGKLTGAEARYAIVDAVTGETVAIHTASIAWNVYRKRWVLIGVQKGHKGTLSQLGEVWYAEAENHTGPWRKAVKIASHPNYSFYNPRQHTFLDEADGRLIYFEGTYTRTFSGNPVATPRYEYNQIMYRLDLADDRLKVAMQ